MMQRVILIEPGDAVIVDLPDGSYIKVTVAADGSGRIETNRH